MESNYSVLRKNEVDTYEPPVFAPDFSAADSAVKMLTNFQWAFYAY